jgi:hypothetical protein
MATAIDTRHEQAAALAAHGWGRVMRRPGVANAFTDAVPGGTGRETPADAGRRATSFRQWPFMSPMRQERNRGGATPEHHASSLSQGSLACPSC